MNSLVLENIENIVSVYESFQKTFSPAAIKLKPENIILNLIFRVIAVTAAELYFLSVFNRI